MHITHTRARARTHRERTLSLFGPGVGLCGITITQTALVLALQYVPAFNASLMQPSQPVLTLLLALCLRLEKLRLRSVSGALKLAGVLIGCAGAANRLEAKRRLGSATAQRPWPPGAGAPGSRLRYAPGPDRRTAQGPIAQSPNRPMGRMRCGRAARPKSPILRRATQRPGATYTVLSAAELRPSGGGGGGGGSGSGGGGPPGVQSVSGALLGNGLLVLQVS